MPLLEDKNNSQNKPLSILKPKLRDDEKKDIVKPYLEIIQKDDHGKWVVTGKTSGVTGRIKRVAHVDKEYTKDGKPQKYSFVEVYIEDATDTYKIDFSYKIATRTLFSRLLSLTDGENVEISLWRDDKGFEVWSAKQNGVNIPRKYVKDDLPEVKEVDDGTQIIKLYGPLNKFFKDELAKWNDSLPKKSAAKQVVSNPQEVEEEDESEEIPF